MKVKVKVKGDISRGREGWKEKKGKRRRKKREYEGSFFGV